MFRFRFFLAAALTTLLLVTGVEAAHASESNSFRLFGEVSNEAVPASLHSTNFQLSEGGVGWRSNALTSTHFVLGPGTSGTAAETDDEVEESVGNVESAGSEEESSSSDAGGNSGGGGGGGGRRTLPSKNVSVQEKTSADAKSSFTELEKRVQDLTTETPFVLTLTEEENTPSQRLPSKKIAPSRRVLARRVIAPASLRTVASPASPSIDLQSLIALTFPRRIIAGRELRFQDSWHRPRMGLFGAEVAEAYSAAPDTPAERIGRIVDLINQNLLLSALLIFSAVMLSVIGSSANMRQHCTTIVCVLERDILHIRPRMQHARLLLRAFLLLLSIGTFFWLTTAYAFAATTTTPLRSVYNGRLLSSTGAALVSSHAIRFSLWTSADAVSGDTTGTGFLNTGAATYAGWQEVHTVTPDSSGYFSVELGSVTALPSLDSLSASMLLSLFLQVDVKAASAAETAYELLDRDTSSTTIDRSPMLSVPFALNADMLDQREIGSGSGAIPLLESGGVLSKSAIPSGLTRDMFTIDSDDSATAPTLRFGEVLAKTLSHSSGSFRFDDDLAIAGSLTIDHQGTADSPHILFGSGGTFDTALFRSAAATLRTSGAFQVGDTLSGASTVTFSALKNCSGLGTNGNGVVSCATTPIVIRKSADESLTGSTVLQDDDALTFSISANETWAFSMYIIGDAHSTPDFNFAVTAPSGSSCAYTVNATENNQGSAHTTCGERSDKMDGEGANVPYAIHGTVVAGSTAGSVILQWSQNSSNSNAVTVRAGSYLMAQRIQ